MKYSLFTLLKHKGYVRVPLKKAASGHYICKAVLNGVSGDFIVDTGASHTCVAWDKEAHFKLNANKAEQQAASASSTEMETRHSEDNVLEVGAWEGRDLEIILFDMTSVNNALEQLDVKAVDGILGADILKATKAVLDYNRNGLYLKIKR
jgi:predicted aspartyl protease